MSERSPNGRQRPPRYLPAFLSALIPGLGQLVSGRRREAILFLTPIIVLVVLTILIVLFAGPARVVGALVDSGVLWALIAIQLFIIAWRLIAMWSSLNDPRLPPLGRRDVIPVALLVGLVVVPQAWAVNITNVARETAEQVFIDEGTTGAWVPTQSAEPSATPSWLPALPSIPSLDPSPSPVVERITGLVVGVDAGVGRNTYLTDTMIVVSLDPTTETASMVSIPRDLVDVPLPNGKRFSGKINGLVSYARRHKAQFPGSNGQGVDVLMAALGELLKVKIDYYALVNLGGFIPVVDKLGGVDVHVDNSFCDPSYDEYGFTAGFSIKAGWRHLNGKQALAYARVRKAAGESDFTRAARQQEVLSGIRDAVVKGRFLNDPVGLIRQVGKTVSTNVPRGKVGEFLEHATRVDRGKTYRGIMLGNNMIMSGYDGRGYVLKGDLAKIRAFSKSLFPTDGRLPNSRFTTDVEERASGSTKKLSSGVSGCRGTTTSKPAAKPTPKPSAKPKPSVKASPSPAEEPSTAPSPVEPSPDPSPVEPSPESVTP